MGELTLSEVSKAMVVVRAERDRKIRSLLGRDDGLEPPIALLEDIHTLCCAAEDLWRLHHRIEQDITALTGAPRPYE